VDLVDDHRPDVVRPLHEPARIPEGERDHGRPGPQGDRERLLVERRHHVVDGERAIGQRPHLSDLPIEALGRREDGPDAAEPAGVRDGRDQLRGRGRPDGGLNDRVLDPNQLTQPRAQHRAPPFGLRAAAYGPIGPTVRFLALRRRSR
jgi:hypothetical protein